MGGKTDCGKQSAEDQLVWAPLILDRGLLNPPLLGIRKIIYRPGGTSFLSKEYFTIQ